MDTFGLMDEKPLCENECQMISKSLPLPVAIDVQSHLYWFLHQAVSLVLQQKLIIYSTYQHHMRKKLQIRTNTTKSKKHKTSILLHRLLYSFYTKNNSYNSHEEHSKFNTKELIIRNIQKYCIESFLTHLLFLAVLYTV